MLRPSCVFTPIHRWSVVLVECQSQRCVLVRGCPYLQGVSPPRARAPQRKSRGLGGGPPSMPCLRVEPSFFTCGCALGLGVARRATGGGARGLSFFFVF